MKASSVSLPQRLWLSWLCAFRIVFDERFAVRVALLREREARSERARSPAELTPRKEPVAAPEPSAPAPKTPAPAAVLDPAAGALQLLSLLQREGRFVDFVEQDVTAFSDADVGAAARVVHEGCRRALHAHARVVSLRTENEGAKLTLERASDEVKLVGNVAGSAPFRGVLRHRGWRVEGLTLPTLVGTQDGSIVAQAEVELP